MINFNTEYRWTVKDSVFKHLFKIKEYSLKLYKTLMPQDDDITENDIDIVTCETVLMNGLYNDLGLLVRNTILFLMEAQSTWSINILIRDFLYLALSYKENLSKLSATQENNIISQYVEFIEMSDDFVKKYGRSKKNSKNGYQRMYK